TTGAPADTWDVGPAPTRALLWLPSGEIAASNETGRISLLARGQQAPVRTFEPTPAHKAVNSLSLSPDDKTLAVAYDDGALLLIDAPSAKLLRELPKGRQIGTVAWSPNGKLLALTSVAFDIKILDTQGQIVDREDVGYYNNGYD